MKCNICGAEKRQRVSKITGKKAGWRCRVCDRKPGIVGAMQGAHERNRQSPVSLNDEEMADVPQISSQDRAILAEPSHFTWTEVQHAQQQQQAVVGAMEAKKRRKNRDEVQAAVIEQFCKTCLVECEKAENDDETY